MSIAARRRFGIAAVVSALAMLFSMIGVGPAAASHDGADAGVFQGTATVGDSWNVNCDLNDPQSADDADATGQGIWLPGFQNGTAGNTSNVTGNIQGTYDFGTVIQTLGHGTGELHACGELDGAQNTVGAACGSSRSDGVALVTDDDSAHEVEADYTWEATAGGTLPITGTWSDTAGNSGTLVSVVQAQGGQDCFPAPVGSGNGAQNFQVVGVALLLP